MRPSGFCARPALRASDARSHGPRPTQFAPHRVGNKTDGNDAMRSTPRIAMRACTQCRSSRPSCRGRLVRHRKRELLQCQRTAWLNHLRGRGSAVVRHRQACAKPLAQLTKRPVGHADYRREHDGWGNEVTTDTHPAVLVAAGPTYRLVILPAIGLLREPDRKPPALSAPRRPMVRSASAKNCRKNRFANPR